MPIDAVRPNAVNAINLSSNLAATEKPLHINTVNSKITNPAPKNPSSSPIIEKIKETGEFTEVYLGIRGYDKEMISSIDSTIRLKKGIYVYEVERNSPAEKAGIEENDIILSIQNEEIETMCGLREVLYSKNVGEVVNMTLIRNSIPVSINVKLEEKQ